MAILQEGFVEEREQELSRQRGVKQPWNHVTQCSCYKGRNTRAPELTETAGAKQLALIFLLFLREVLNLSRVRKHWEVSGSQFLSTWQLCERLVSPVHCWTALMLTGLSQRAIMFPRCVCWRFRLHLPLEEGSWDESQTHCKPLWSLKWYLQELYKNIN